MKDGFSGSRILVLPQMIVKMQQEDPVMSNLHVTDIGYFPHATLHRIERTVPIRQHVLIYCADGRGHYWVETSPGRREKFEVGANQYFILPPGLAHSYWADDVEPWTIYWIHFAGSQAHQYCKSTIEPQTVRMALHSRINVRHQLFEEIFNILEEGFMRENLLYSCACLVHYLASLLYLSSYRQATTEKIIDMDNFVAAAIHFMKENIDKRLKLDDIACYTGFSTSHFSAIFRQATGHAPLAYFNIMKMQEACQLLDQTQMQINQICYKVGIDDCYYFSRQFKNIVGMSPTDYRATRKG